MIHILMSDHSDNNCDRRLQLHEDMTYDVCIGNPVVKFKKTKIQMNTTDVLFASPMTDTQND